MLFFMLQLVSTASVTICLNAKHSGSIFGAVRQTNTSVHMSVCLSVCLGIVLRVWRWMRILQAHCCRLVGATDGCISV